MQRQNDLATKSVTFRFGEENFKVNLIFEKQKGKLKALPASVTFLNFLRTLNLVSISEDNETWLENCDGKTFTYFTKSKNSLKIRKKAALCGLEVFPGESFIKNKELGCQLAAMH